MTIRKGQEWGRVGPPPDGLVPADDDAALFRVLNGATDLVAVGLRGGDLFRTLGGTPRPHGSADAGKVVIVTVDVGVAHHDGGIHRFAAHAVARGSWWRGRLLGVLNAQYLGHWDVAPRSHPNDGALDVVDVEASMGLRQRWGARSRLPTASHLPHPQISTKRVRAAEWAFERPLTLRLDGVVVGRTSTLRVEVQPDALTVCI